MKDLWRLSHFSQFTNPNPNSKSNSTHTCIHTRTHTHRCTASSRHRHNYTNANFLLSLAVCIYTVANYKHFANSFPISFIEFIFNNLLLFISQICLLHHLLFFLLYVFGYVCVCVWSFRGFYPLFLLCFVLFG